MPVRNGPEYPASISPRLERLLSRLRIGPHYFTTDLQGRTVLVSQTRFKGSKLCSGSNRQVNVAADTFQLKREGHDIDLSIVCPGPDTNYTGSDKIGCGSYLFLDRKTHKFLPLPNGKIPNVLYEDPDLYGASDDKEE